ncbi:MAG: hypothetical protein HYU51_15925 [Candidatus Rokubacteria bacterium]|nr:hypothetical protein [Candidatus Rokubacteria bacterium]
MAKYRKGTAGDDGGGPLARRDAEILPALTTDLELRPRDAKPVTLNRLVGDVLTGVSDDLARLRQLAEDARREKNGIVEMQLRAKLCDLGAKLLALGREGRTPVGPPQSQEDLPDWGALPEDVRFHLEEAFRLMDERGIEPLTGRDRGN